MLLPGFGFTALIFSFPAAQQKNLVVCTGEIAPWVISETGLLVRKDGHRNISIGFRELFEDFEPRFILSTQDKYHYSDY